MLEIYTKNVYSDYEMPLVTNCVFLAICDRAGDKTKNGQVNEWM